MPTRRSLQEYQRAQQRLLARAERELARFADRLDWSDLVRAREQFKAFLPELAAVYGEATATVAAEWYDELRSEAGARGPFSAVLADIPGPEVIHPGLVWAMQPGFDSGDIGAARDRIGRVTARHIRNAGRNTIAASAELDPAGPRWARVPTRMDPCAFCVMLASRGPVYWTQETAELSAAGRTYHSDCGCDPVPVWEGDPLPDGYDPDALYQIYQDARAVAGGDTRAILAEMRLQQGIH